MVIIAEMIHKAVVISQKASNEAGKKKKDFDNWVENSQDPGLDSLKAEAQKLAESFDVVE